MSTYELKPQYRHTVALPGGDLKVYASGQLFAGRGRELLFHLPWRRPHLTFGNEAAGAGW